MPDIESYTSVTIREQDPLKQGLKQSFDEHIKGFFFIREQDPLKQGLKPVCHTLTPFLLPRFASKIH